MLKKRGLGQSWSLDIILAVVIFVLIIGIFYTVLGSNKKDKTQELTLESKTVVSNLDMANGQTSNLTIIDAGEIDTDDLRKLYMSDYDNLKKELGIKGEFCIYLVDQYGKLITVNTTSGDIGSFGNPDFILNGKPCGDTLP
ncbi:MAG: hypothetical protein ACP5NW_00300 [Candidatus Woesearchaeota archaeon]